MGHEHPLSRDCAATTIPSGQPVTLPAGTRVFVTQALGGNVTVRTDGGLFRIAAADAAEAERAARAIASRCLTGLGGMGFVVP